MFSSALAPLLKPVAALPATMSISDVADRPLTAEHKAFLSLPVVDDHGRPLGLVSRSRLQDIFMQRFGHDLWGWRPVVDVMNAEPLIVALETSLEEAARQLQDHSGLWRQHPGRLRDQERHALPDPSTPDPSRQPATERLT